MPEPHSANENKDEFWRQVVTLATSTYAHQVSCTIGGGRGSRWRDNSERGLEGGGWKH